MHPKVGDLVEYSNTMGNSLGICDIGKIGVVIPYMERGPEGNWIAFPYRKDRFFIQFDPEEMPFDFAGKGVAAAYSYELKILSPEQLCLK